MTVSMGMSISCTAMREAVANTTAELIELAKKIGGKIDLHFFEGRGALKANFYVCVQGAIHVISFKGDDGWDDYHRNPLDFFNVMKEVEKLDSSVIKPHWRLESLKNLISTIWDVKKEERRIRKYEDSSHPAPQSWLKNCQSLPKGLIREYIKAL